MTRPLQLRFLLITLALVVAAVWWPQFALQLLAGLGCGPVMLMKPVFGSGVSCPACSGDLPGHTGVQLVMGGIVNGTCTNCSIFNATSISTSVVVGGVACEALFPVFAGAPACTGNLLTAAHNFIWNTTLVQGSGGESGPTTCLVAYRATQSAGYTCLQNYLAIPHHASAGCDGTGGTCDVTM